MDKKISDDDVIVVEMPRGEYLLMRSLIKDYQAASRVWRIAKTFSLVFIGVVMGWIGFGEKIILFFKKF